MVEIPREPLLVRHLTEVRLETPFSFVDLQNYIITVRDEIGEDAAITAEIAWPDGTVAGAAIVALVANRTIEVEGFNPRPQAGEES